MVVVVFAVVSLRVKLGCNSKEKLVIKHQHNSRTVLKVGSVFLWTEAGTTQTLL